MVGARILVIDDDQDFIRRMQAALQGVGELHATTCGVQGLQAAERWEPDVVMLDLLLHDVDGFALLEQLTGLDGRHRPAVLCLTGGHGAGMRPVPFPEWPVGTVPRGAPAAQLRTAVLHAARLRQDALDAAVPA